LRTFFKHRRKNSERKPTADELERDVHALTQGRKDGEIFVEREHQHETGNKLVVKDNTC
jgi:hypothetical protein